MYYLLLINVVNINSNKYFNLFYYLNFLIRESTSCAETCLIKEFNSYYI